MNPDQPTTIHGFTVVNAFRAAQLDGTHLGKAVHIEYADENDILTTSLGILRSVQHTESEVNVFLVSHKHAESLVGLKLHLEVRDTVTLLNR